MRIFLIWGALAIAIVLPVLLAANSPLLAWRDPVYIAAGFCGVIAMGLLLVQPLLAAGLLPGISPARARMVHRGVGAFLALSVILHVGGLWVTSPPDVIDALLFVSPTPFSAWGVVAMWAMFCTIAVAALRRPARLTWRSWRVAHSVLAVIIVAGSVIHAVLIEGTMEVMSKLALCALVILASGRVLFDPKTLARLRQARPKP